MVKDTLKDLVGTRKKMELGSRGYLEKCLPTQFQNEISEFRVLQPSEVYSEDERKNFGEDFLQQISFKAEIRTNFTSETEAKAWVAEFSQKSGCSFSVERTHPKAKRYIHELVGATSS